MLGVASCVFAVRYYMSRRRIGAVVEAVVLAPSQAEAQCKDDDSGGARASPSYDGLNNNGASLFHLSSIIVSRFSAFSSSSSIHRPPMALGETKRLNRDVLCCSVHGL